MTPAEVGISFAFEETEDTFIGNAYGKALALRHRARAATVASDVPVVADDSGLCVDALDGRPGVYSARFGSPDAGTTELGSEARNALLLSHLTGVENRAAHFVCCMIVLFNPDRFYVVQERWDGAIANEPSSASGGFGYDPIFYLPEYGCTAADLNAEEKNRLSHRGKAAASLAALLKATTTR